MDLPTLLQQIEFLASVVSSPNDDQQGTRSDDLLTLRRRTLRTYPGILAREIRSLA
jgi:hypothetical protein